MKYMRYILIVALAIPFLLVPNLASAEHKKPESAIDRLQTEKLPGEWDRSDFYFALQSNEQSAVISLLKLYAQLSAHLENKN